jgi:hypothetical protein
VPAGPQGHGQIGNGHGNGDIKHGGTEDTENDKGDRIQHWGKAVPTVSFSGQSWRGCVQLPLLFSVSSVPPCLTESLP